MEKDFIPYELAVKLKELGFNEPCIMQWHYANDLLFCKDIWGHPKYKTNLESKSDSSGDCISAPIFSQAFRWFREKGYRYTISFESFMKNGMFYFEIWENGKCWFESDFDYNTYEEAELACLTKLIEILETRT